MQLAEALIRSPAAAGSMPSRLINDTLSASHLDHVPRGRRQINAHQRF